MKRIIASALLLVLSGAPVVAQDFLAPPLLSSLLASEIPTDFYFSLEAIAMGRSDATTRLGFDNSSGDEVDFTTPDLGSTGWANGLRFSAGAHLVGRWGLQVSGLGVGGFTAGGEKISDSYDLFSAYDVSGTSGNQTFSNSRFAYAARFSESSSIGSLEANVIYDLDGVRLFAGPRVIVYQASLGTTFFDDMDAYEQINTYRDTIAISSANTLVGTQIGVEGTYALSEVISIGARAALGLYANLAVLNRSYDDGGSGQSPFGVSPVVASSGATGFAQSVEVSPQLNLALTQALSLTLGATLLWLNGVDEPGAHYAAMGAPGCGCELAADSPQFRNGVSLGGWSAGLRGQF